MSRKFGARGKFSIIHYTVRLENFLDEAVKNRIARCLKFSAQIASRSMSIRILPFFSQSQ